MTLVQFLDCLCFILCHLYKLIKRLNVNIIVNSSTPTIYLSTYTEKKMIPHFFKVKKIFELHLNKKIMLKVKYKNVCKFNEYSFSVILKSWLQKSA